MSTRRSSRGEKGERQSKTSKVMVFIRGFKSNELVLGPVKLGVLKLEREEWEEKSVRKGLTAVDTLLEYAARIRRYPWTRDMDYVEIIVEGKGLRAMYGGRPGYKWRRMIFPSPSRLIRVGIASLGEASGKTVINESSIEWFHVPEEGEFYVFEGDCSISVEGKGLVVVETSDGRRILTDEACSAS